MDWVKVSTGWVNLSLVAYLEIPEGGDCDLVLSGGERITIPREEALGIAERIDFRVNRIPT